MDTMMGGGVGVVDGSTLFYDNDWDIDITTTTNTDCVVLDFNGGLCINMRHEGLFYAFMSLLGLIQLVGLCRRLISREINFIPNYSVHNVREWHLTFGRIGLLFMILSITLENFRLFMGSFDGSWPSYVLAAGTNVTKANDSWGDHHYTYRDINVQRFLWCYSWFLVTIFAPFLLYSSTQLLYKHRQWRRAFADGLEEEEELLYRREEKNWFVGTSVMVLIAIVCLISSFVMGPIQHGVRLVRVTGIWSLATYDGSMTTNSMVLAIALWLSSMIVAAILLLLWGTITTKVQRTGLIQWIIVNSIALLLTTIPCRDNSYWLPAVSQLFIQWSIVLHRKWDGIYNPGDFCGRLSYEELRESVTNLLFHNDTTTTITTSNNNNNNDEEEGTATTRMDQLRQPLLTASENNDDDDDNNLNNNNNNNNNNDDEESSIVVGNDEDDSITSGDQEDNNTIENNDINNERTMSEEDNNNNTIENDDNNNERTII